MDAEKYKKAKKIEIEISNCNLHLKKLTDLKISRRNSTVFKKYDDHNEKREFGQEISRETVPDYVINEALQVVINYLNNRIKELEKEFDKEFDKI